MKDKDDVQSAMVGNGRRIHSDVPGVMYRLTGVERRTAQREASWREENKAAIEESNAELERKGLWCDDYRLW